MSWDSHCAVMLRHSSPLTASCDSGGGRRGEGEVKAEELQAEERGEPVSAWPAAVQRVTTRPVRADSNAASTTSNPAIASPTGTGDSRLATAA